MKQIDFYKNINNTLFCGGSFFPPIALIIAVVFLVFYSFIFLFRLVKYLRKNETSFFVEDARKKRLFIFLGLYVAISLLFFLINALFYPVSLILLAIYLMFGYRYFPVFKNKFGRWMIGIFIFLLFVVSLYSFVLKTDEIHNTIVENRALKVLENIKIPGEIKTDNYNKCDYEAMHNQPVSRSLIVFYEEADPYSLLLNNLGVQGYEVVEEKVEENDSVGSWSFSKKGKGVLLEHEKHGWLSVFIHRQDDLSYIVDLEKLENYSEKWSDYKMCVMYLGDCGLSVF